MIAINSPTVANSGENQAILHGVSARHYYPELHLQSVCITYVLVCILHFYNNYKLSNIITVANEIITEVAHNPVQ